jgi:hypothetical protein
MVKVFGSGFPLVLSKKGRAEDDNSLCFFVVLQSAIEHLPLLAAGKFAGIFVGSFATTTQSWSVTFSLVNLVLAGRSLHVQAIPSHDLVDRLEPNRIACQKKLKEH